jgi:ribonuclease P protein component
VEEKYSRSDEGKAERVLPSRTRPTSSAVRSIGRPDQSFPKTDRLLKRSDFIRVQKHGKKYGTRSLLLLVQPNKLGRTRLGIVVSKKVGNSAQRSRIKRIIREAFRLNRGLFPANADVVIIPKVVSHRLEYGGLVEEMRAVGGRIRT